MKLLETLMKEHRLIEKVLDSLEIYLLRIQGPEDVGRQDLGRYVDFIRGYADALHHGKEESLLFRAMEENGFSRTAGPLAVMYAEHEEGRRLVGILAAAADTETAWDAPIRSRAADAGLRFVGMLRAHIYKEDHVLYRMAGDNLPEDVQRQLDEQAREFDGRHRSSGEYSRLGELAEELARREGSGSADKSS